MTATEELRRLLDERGVEHGDVESAPYPPYNSTRRMTTFWTNKCVWQYIEDEREGGDIELVGRYMSMSVTPAQAIAATLGPGTCQADETDTWECVCDGIGHYGVRMTIHVMECSECGRTYEHVNGSYECCPHCGRRIVEVNDG